LDKSYPLVESSTLAGTEFRLWLEGEPVRQRQNVMVSWLKPEGSAQTGPPPDWVLWGPDDLPRYPASLDGALAIFTVGTDWPSGDYRLGLANSTVQTGPLFTVAAEARLFSLPAELANQPGWQPVEANFADKIKLLGYVISNHRLPAGDTLTLKLAWQSLAPVLPDTLTFAVLLDGRQQPYGQVDRYPAGFYSPMLWAEGEVVPDTLALPIRPDTPPGIYFLHVGQYQLINDQPVSLPLVHQGQPTNSTAVVIGPFKVGGPPPEVTVSRPAPQVSLNQPVGDQIRLLGYDLNLSESQIILNGESPVSHSQAAIPSAPSLKLTLYWQAEAAIQSDYTTFLHLRDGANQTVAQKDQPPAAGAYPTSLWDKGEVIVDEIILPLDQVTPGEYQLVVGLYDYGSGARLPVPGIPANEVMLQPIRVE
jgi:hypothetical protein